MNNNNINEDRQDNIVSEEEALGLEQEYVEEDSGAKEKIQKLQESLKKCQQEKSEYLQGWQRQKADFINYKKDEQKRLENIVKFAKESIVFELLPILDSFAIAVENIPKEASESGWFGGIKAIFAQLENNLKREGLEKIEALGKEFDPNFHESVGEVESEEEDGIIIEEVRKGYIFGGKVLRSSSVKISKKK